MGEQVVKNKDYDKDLKKLSLQHHQIKSQTADTCQEIDRLKT